MASRYQKFTTLIDPNRFWLECIFCGQKWSPNFGSRGRLPRFAYVCPNGCTHDYEEAMERYRKMLFKRNPLTGRMEPYKKTVEVEDGPGS